MTGTPSDSGLLPRCLDVIFNTIGELQSAKYVGRQLSSCMHLHSLVCVAEANQLMLWHADTEKTQYSFVGKVGQGIYPQGLR